MMHDRIFKNDIKILEQLPNKKPYPLWEIIGDCMVIGGLCLFFFLFIYFTLSEIHMLMAKM